MTSGHILVTGANGLIGSEAVALLLNAGYRVTAIVRENVRGLEHRELFPLSVDLSTDWDDSLLPAKIDAVIHLAQSPFFRSFPEKADDVLAVNTITSHKLLCYARKSGATHFVLGSSGGIYGYGDSGFTEDALPLPGGALGHYLGTKLCAEILADSYSKLMNVQVLRFFFVYGQKQKREMLMPRIADNVKSGRPVFLNGENGIRINPIHVSDAARCIVDALRLPGSNTINIAGKEVVSIREIASVFGELIGKPPVFEYSNEPARNLIGDVEKMTRLFGANRISLRSGITELL